MIHIFTKCIFILYFIHYLTFDPAIAMLFFFSIRSFIFCNDDLSKIRKQEELLLWIRVYTLALFFQEIIGHTVGGDDKAE